MRDWSGSEESGVRTGRPPKVSDDQIRDEIVNRMSGDPADLVPYRIQRALETSLGATPKIQRIHRLMSEMQAQRQVPASLPRQPQAELESFTNAIRLALDEVAGQISRLMAQAVLTAEDALRDQGSRALAARDAEISLLRDQHAGEILRRDAEIGELMRSADDRLDEIERLRDQSDGELACLNETRKGQEERLLHLEADRADLERRLQVAEADRAAQQNAAERVQGENDRLNTRLGELASRLAIAEAERDQARVYLLAEQGRSAVAEKARVTAEARLGEIRGGVDRLEATVERARQDAAEAGKRVAVLETILAAERRRTEVGKEQRRPQRQPGSEPGRSHGPTDGTQGTGQKPPVVPSRPVQR
jgi:chromosome segregation ATPase